MAFLSDSSRHTSQLYENLLGDFHFLASPTACHGVVHGSFGFPPTTPTMA
jgi:hypothetical protein